MSIKLDPVQKAVQLSTKITELYQWASEQEIAPAELLLNFASYVVAQCHPQINAALQAMQDRKVIS